MIGSGRAALVILALHVALPGAAHDVCFRRVSVPHQGFKVPHLAHYADPAIQAAVNRQIDAAVADAGCSDDPAVQDKTLKAESDVRFTAKDIFSVYISLSYFCGAYPENDDNRSQTFDLRTGKAVTFERLFRDYEADKALILRAIFRQQIEAAERWQAAGRKDGDSCDDSPGLFALSQLEESTYLFNFSPRGLEVQPSWPHVTQACAQRVTVPYRHVKPFAAPGGLLERVLGKGRSQ